MPVANSSGSLDPLPLPQSVASAPHANPAGAHGDVALFVDWENLKASLNKTGMEPNVSSLRDIAEQFGRVVIASSYADWQDPWHHRDPAYLYSAGIEPVYVPTTIRHGAGGPSSPFARRRNSVDVKLTADCIECCFKYPNVKTFILVSGDGDFIHLVNTLRPYGRAVVAVGVSWSTSVQLAESVDQLLYYDRDVDPVEPPPGSDHVRQLTEQDELGLQEAFERVVTIIRSSQNGGRALLSWVKHELIKRYGRFNEKQWGFSQFKGFIREAEQRGLLKIVERDLVNWAYLPEAWEQIERQSGLVRPGNGARGRYAQLERSDGMVNAARDQLIRFAHDVEMKSPYVSFTFLHDRLMEAQLFHFNHQETSDLLNEAVEETIFLHGSFQDTRSGSVRTIRTIALNHNHPYVARALGETPLTAGAGDEQETVDPSRNLPGLMKPGGDARLAEDLRALTKHPDRPEIEYRVGARLHELGRCSEAVEHLRRAADRAPNRPDYLCALARCLKEDHRPEQALAICSKAVDKFEDDPLVHRTHGDVLVAAGRHDSALDAYGRTLELLPADDDIREKVWVDRINVCLTMERPDSALHMVQAALEQIPDSSRLKEVMESLQSDDRRQRAENLGRHATSLVSQLGREEEVISFAQEALKLSEGVYQPFYALGEIYMRQGRLEEAVESFERAVPICPSPGAIYSMRMRLVGLYERLDRHDAAVEMRALLG